MAEISLKVISNETTISVESDIDTGILGQDEKNQACAQLAMCMVQASDALNIPVETVIEHMRLAVTVRETNATAMIKKGLTS